jgi:hypothetical protein
MNPFKRHPRIRRAMYMAQYVTSGAMMLTAVGYGAADAPLPHWYGVTAAVLAAFWSYTGFQAHQNTPGDEGEGV